MEDEFKLDEDVFFEMKTRRKKPVILYGTIVAKIKDRWRVRLFNSTRTFLVLPEALKKMFP